MKWNKIKAEKKNSAFIFYKKYNIIYIEKRKGNKNMADFYGNMTDFQELIWDAYGIIPEELWTKYKGSPAQKLIACLEFLVKEYKKNCER